MIEATIAIITAVGALIVTLCRELKDSNIHSQCCCWEIDIDRDD